jgi:hypothetical protein
MKASSQTLNQTASFWVAAAVVAHTLWTSAVAAMTYRLYTATGVGLLSLAAIALAIMPQWNEIQLIQSYGYRLTAIGSDADSRYPSI